MTVLFCMGNLRITSVSQRCLDRLQRAIAQKNPLAVRNSIILFTMLEYRCGTRQKIGKLNTKRGLVRPTTHRAHYRPSRGLPVASCAWHLSLAGPAAAGRLCGSSGQSSLAPSMLLQLPPSALLSVLCADTTALRAILGSARCGRSGCEASTANAGAHSAQVRQAYGWWTVQPCGSHTGMCNVKKLHVRGSTWQVDLLTRASKVPARCARASRRGCRRRTRLRRS